MRVSWGRERSVWLELSMRNSKTVLIEDEST